MSIELYVFPPSPRAFKVMAVANHLGLDCVQHMVDLGKGEQRAPDYAALNPNMRMPTLRDGDFVIWESNAIIQYLASRKPESGLLPREEKARLDVTRWQFWDLAHWDPACAVFVWEYLVKPALLGIKEPDEAALAKGTESFHRVAKVLDGQLTGRKFVTGDTLTLADFSLGAGLIYTDAAHLPLEPYGEIKRWYATLSALPSWQKTLAQSMARAPATAA
jgi:glutathione S-transferase